MSSSAPHISTREMNKGIHKCKTTLEKIIVTIVSSFWLTACFYDIAKMSCFWSDYMLEAYSSFMVFCLVMHVLWPKKVKKEIYMYFGIITHTYGRGILFVLISLLFLSDEHLFHKSAAAGLMGAGVFLVVLEICVPTPKEDRFKVPKIEERIRPPHAEVPQSLELKETESNSVSALSVKSEESEVRNVESGESVQKSESGSSNPYYIPEDF